MKKFLSMVLAALMVVTVMQFSTVAGSSATYTASDVSKSLSVTNSKDAYVKNAVLAADGFLLYKVTATEAGVYDFYVESGSSMDVFLKLLSDPFESDAEIAHSGDVYNEKLGGDIIQQKMKKGDVVYFAIVNQDDTSVTMNVHVKAADSFKVIDGVIYENSKITDSEDAEHWIVYGELLDSYSVVSIESKIDNVAVTTIGSEAFYECKYLTGIVIPESIESIGSFAFADSSLTNIAIQGKETTLGNGFIDPYITVYGYTNSTAENYVKDYKEVYELKFVSMDSYDCTKAHNYITTGITAEPDCQTTGKGYKTCVKCGKTVSATLDKIAHEIINYSICEYCLRPLHTHTSVKLGQTVEGYLLGQTGEEYNLSDFIATCSVPNDGSFKIKIADASEDVMYLVGVIDPTTGTEDANAGISSETTYTTTNGCGEIDINAVKGENVVIQVCAPEASEDDVTFNVTVECNHKSCTKKVVKPTYAAKGYTLNTCKICGESFKTNYTAKLTVAKTAIKALTAGKGKLAVKWSKKVYSGYQIQVSLKKSFSSKKTVTVKGSTNVKKTITGLKSGKKYYVRVRAYKTYKGKKYYSAWSKIKATTTK